ncbi:MAG: DapH/DapD/GlmU-related protein [Candidatus Altiarchaeota archaeon]
MDQKVYADVRLGVNPWIGEYVVLGVIPSKMEKPSETVIGDNAVIRSHTVIYAGNKIGDNFQTGHHTLIRENNVIGDDVSIGSSSDVAFNVKIGDKVRIHSNVFIPEYSVLEDACWIGPNTVLTNALHPQCPDVKDCLKGPTIKSGAKIGANSTILPCVVVGRNCLVGAGSVVTKDVPDGAVVVGNPAKIVKKTAEISCRFGRRKGPYSIK